MMRKTIAHDISIDGTALHSGSRVTLTLAPAESGTGIVFRRNDLDGATIAARHDLVTETRLGTVIAANGASVGVIEHLMAAIAGAEIDDLLVVLDGPEPPILDGDAASYLALIDAASLTSQPGTRQAIRVKQRVEARHGEAYAVLSPCDTREFDFEISFATPAIGTQHLVWNFSPEGFRRDIGPARTFGFLAELEALNAQGLARGASLENTLAIDGDGLANAGLQRFPDEFVRHKILDAIGDLALAGGPLIGRFEGRRSGHALNNALLRALFADPANYEAIPA
ncbi:MAG TPA: UDP-3-O-acyl-N-acetylglucosamine deacetylase [Rhizomicrobium sp.]|jgi:UDP-3-O-[3-hydroxymyristoyl] N-acetylglucosamine deacetylase